MGVQRLCEIYSLWDVSTKSKSEIHKNGRKCTGVYKCVYVHVS